MKSNDKNWDEDERLLSQWQNGDVSGYEGIYRKYYPIISSYFTIFYIERNTILDLTQEVFIRLYKKPEAYKGKSSFSTFINSIAKNVLREHLREKQNKQLSVQYLQQIESKLSGTSTPEKELSLTEYAGKIDQALATLTAKERELLEMASDPDVSSYDMQQRFGYDSKQLRNKLYYTRKALQKIMDSNEQKKAT